jgi:hypothetical protein
VGRIGKAYGAWWGGVAPGSESVDIVVEMASVDASVQALWIVRLACEIVKDKQAWLVVMMRALTWI